MKRIIVGISLAYLLCASTHAAWLGAALDAQSAGALVVGVAEGSPAARAGMREGDVIVTVQSRAVGRADEVVQMMRAASPGTKVRLGLMRNGRPMDVMAVLAQAPAAAPVPAQLAGARPAVAGARAVLPRGGVPMSVTQTGRCSAYVPQGWSLVTNPNASAADLMSPDRRAYAGWGVRGINRAMEQFYGPMHGDPETAAAYMAGQALKNALGDGSGLRFTSAPQNFLGYFTLRRFETARSQGLLFYRAYPGMTPQEYVESTYFAMADKSLGAAGLLVASGVATTIRCETQLTQQSRPGGERQGTRAGCGGEGSLRGYNKELGSQQVHSAATGENYLMDHATQWQENGPQGPGYYKQNGNFQEKLELGRSDDC